MRLFEKINGLPNVFEVVIGNFSEQLSTDPSNVKEAFTAKQPEQLAANQSNEKTNISGKMVYISNSDIKSKPSGKMVEISTLFFCLPAIFMFRIYLLVSLSHFSTFILLFSLLTGTDSVLWAAAKASKDVPSTQS